MCVENTLTKVTCIPKGLYQEESILIWFAVKQLLVIGLTYDKTFSRMKFRTDSIIFRRLTSHQWDFSDKWTRRKFQREKWALEWKEDSKVLRPIDVSGEPQRLNHWVVTIRNKMLILPRLVASMRCCGSPITWWLAQESSYQGRVGCAMDSVTCAIWDDWWGWCHPWQGINVCWFWWNNEC